VTRDPHVKTKFFESLATVPRVRISIPFCNNADDEVL